MMSRKNGVCQVIKACVTVGTLIALTGQLRVIKATLDDVFELTRWAVDAVWPAQITYRLITLNIIDQILDIDLHRWTPVRGWYMGWHQCTPYSHSTTLESNMSVRQNGYTTTSHRGSHNPVATLGKRRERPLLRRRSHCTRTDLSNCSQRFRRTGAPTNEIGG